MADPSGIQMHGAAMRHDPSQTAQGPNSPIDGQLNDLDARLEQLGDSVALLDERLECISQGRCPASEGTNAKNPISVSSQHANTLLRFNHQVVSLIERVSDMMRRLEV